jgi:hypothetical protein
MSVPPLAEGNRSLAYRFASLDPESPKPVRLRAVIEGVEPGDSGASDIVNLLFWADLATVYATQGATFDVWYAEAVGEGRILDTTPVPSKEARHAYDLTDRERQLLMSGISEWGGPSRCSDALAKAMGFKSVENLFEEGQRLREHLKFGEPMSTADWARALGATETCFTSSLGSTFDWEITTGFRDDETIELIRGLQIKLVEVGKAMRGGGLF